MLVIYVVVSQNVFFEYKIKQIATWNDCCLFDVCLYIQYNAEAIVNCERLSRQIALPIFWCYSKMRLKLILMSSCFYMKFH